MKETEPLQACVAELEGTEAKAEQRARVTIASLKVDVLRDIPVIVAYHDLNSNIVWANRAYEEATGLSQSEIVGRKCCAAWGLSEACRGCPVLTAIDSGETNESESTPQNQDHWPDSQGYRLSCAAPVHDTNGQVIGAIETAFDIADRKRAKHDLAGSEKRYRRLFESAQGGILILDADTGKIVDVNPFMLDLLGFSYEAFVGKHLWDIDEFEDIAASQVSFRELQTKNYIRYEDLPLQTRDGRRIDVEFVSNVYLVDNQKVIQCNIRDITERRRAEDTLRDKEQRLSMVVEGANVAVWDCDLASDATHWSGKLTEAHLKQVLLGIRNVSQLIVHEDDSRWLIEQACGNLTETLGYHNAWIALLDGEFDALRERLACGEFSACARRALERDETVDLSRKEKP